MFHVDVLSAYLICGVSALIGAGILHLAEIDELRLRRALHNCGWALVTLGVGLLPAGLGAAAAHPAAQLSLGLGSLAGIVLMAYGLGQAQGSEMPTAWLWALLAALAVANTAAQAMDALVYGRVYALGLAGTGTLLFWQVRGFIGGSRSLIERGLGLALGLLCVSSWARWTFTLQYSGPARVDMLYVPGALAPIFAALYGVFPIVLATLLLSLVNARLHQQLRSRATTDELTGTMTRRALRELAPVMIGQRDRRHELAVLMLDLDHFKAVNDGKGHAVGDQVLRVVATTLRMHLRHDALLARYGGEEFVVVLPVGDVPGARRAAERLRLAVEQVDWQKTAGLDGPITVSVGVALVGHSETLDAALQRADEALYRSKREGRNQVQISLMVA
jgi:diguanylate cyclase (GGDEF)-like protein